MRVIAGSARHLPLKTIEGQDTRPTTDRIKETLFNMLQYDLADCRFLDLFSGSGGIGIEALSRGARQAVFIEQNQKAAECIRENLAFTHLEDRGLVMACDVLTGLKKLEGKDGTFDFVFMDPPYHQELEKMVLAYLADSDLIGEDTLLIVEASKETKADYLEELGYYLEKAKVYKTNQHFFIRKNT